MTTASYLWIALVGFILVALAGLGAKVIAEVAWHELKEYCRRQHRKDRFDAIHDSHDAVSLGMETLRAVGGLLLLWGLVGWLTATDAGLPESRAERFLLAGGMLLLFVFATVWLPSTVARIWSSQILFHFWRVFRTAALCVSPLAIVTDALEGVLRRLAGETEEPNEEEAFEDEVMTIVTEGLHDGHLESDARQMIEGVFELGDRNVADIMTPRSNIDAFPIDLGWESVVEFVTTCGRTRIPVYREGLDQIEGILYVKDMLATLSPGLSPRPVEELLREPRFVPKTKPLDDLLQDFRKTRNHLAIVVDEYMSVAGIVTIEDILEEIVGEIVDESDKEQPGEIRRVDSNTADIEGRAHLSEVNQQLGLSLPEPDEYDTIGGFVISRLGRIPQIGETIDWEDVQITVLEASRRKVDRVRLRSLEGIAEREP